MCKNFLDVGAEVNSLEGSGVAQVSRREKPLARGSPITLGLKLSMQRHEHGTLRTHALSGAGAVVLTPSVPCFERLIASTAVPVTPTITALYYESFRRTFFHR